MGAPTLQIVTPIKAFSARSRFPFPRSLHRAGTGTGIPSKSLLTVPSKSVVMLTCRSLAMTGRTRCRMHGGGSTGPRTPEGKQRVGEAARREWVKEVVAAGWVIASPEMRASVARLKAELGGSQNATARALGLPWWGIRRVLAGLPSRPEEARRLASVDFDSVEPKPFVARVRR